MGFVVVVVLSVVRDFCADFPKQIETCHQGCHKLNTHTYL